MLLVPRVLQILQDTRNCYITHNDNEQNVYVHSVSKEQRNKLTILGVWSTDFLSGILLICRMALMACPHALKIIEN